MTEPRSCVKVEDGRPGLPVPNKPTVSVDVKQHFNNIHHDLLAAGRHHSQSLTNHTEVPILVKGFILWI